MKIQLIESRCNQCLLCVRECVSGAWRDMNGTPAMVAPNLCNLCGHCVAVCPKSAVYHEKLDYQQVENTRPDLLNPEVYRELMRSRRSVRQYKDKEVAEDIIQQLLDFARYSPTASNRQNVGYTVITDKALISDIADTVFRFVISVYQKTLSGVGNNIYRLLKVLSPNGISRYLEPMEYYIRETEKGRDFILHGAPSLILVHGPKRGSFVSENCNIAATNIMNNAHAEGLGTCYIGFLVLALKLFPSLRKKIRIPKKRRVRIQ